MDRKAIEKILSTERIAPYLKRQENDFEKAIRHYKANIEISEAFYPLISIFEIGLRNNINEQLIRQFDSVDWFEDHEFVKITSSFQVTRITEARSSILREKKEITPGRVVSELAFGFWTSLFDLKFEKSLWKNLRHAFPNCPKNQRQRKNISSKLNGIRKLRNRIFHHESIAWNIEAIENYRNELIEGINWLNKDLENWAVDLFRIDEVIEKERYTIER